MRCGNDSCPCNQSQTVTITWDWSDVQALRLDWTREQCEGKIAKISKVLRERSIEEGWIILQDLLTIEEKE